jgi:hypothetical protein
LTIARQHVGKITQSSGHRPAWCHRRRNQPQDIFFYAAFFPQFVTPSLPVGRQLAAMSVTMLAIAIASDSLYAGLAVRLRQWLLGRACSRHGITGTPLVTTGVGLCGGAPSVMSVERLPLGRVDRQEES